MRLLSFHPYSLYVSGGGSRILRRLYATEESNVFSLGVSDFIVKSSKQKIEEHIIYASPVQRKWMRWHLRNWASWARGTICANQTLTKIHRAAEKIPHDIIHVVNQGSRSTALCQTNKPIWASFHDDYSVIGSSFQDASQLWNQAERRLVISPEMGQKYQHEFGYKHFELITDGVTEAEISKPHEIIGSPILIYFAGLLHIDYLPLFKSLGNVLDTLTQEGLSFRLILRGTQRVNFLENRRFELEYRPFTVNDIELKEEIDKSDILYFPMKFTSPQFYRYSLSTKMIGYLGGSGAILYHGPGDSAACHLLKKAEAAICCITLEDNDLYKAIKRLINDPNTLSVKAKILAKQEFNLIDIQNRFWQKSKPIYSGIVAEPFLK